MFKLVVLFALVACASAGLYGGYGSIAVAHAPVAVVKHGATSYQNSNSPSYHPVPVAVQVHHAPAVAIHAAPIAIAAPISYGHGIGLGHGLYH